MRFYYDNYLVNKGWFETDNIIKAIYSAWNIETNLYLKDINNNFKLIFSPLEDNDFNSNLLNEFGFYVKDIGNHREIVELKTDIVQKFNLDDTIGLI